MPETAQDEPRTLDALRGRIDAIDAEMHRLLIERGTVIDALVKAKATDRPGAAFRPGREADMMRRIAARHDGALPLTTVEHIWREIIATFTCMQAPYEVAIDVSVEEGRMRDLARFVFGFSVPLVARDDAAGVVAQVAEGRDLGVIARAAKGAWWSGLKGEARPGIMAVLPFIHLAERPADLPAFVISPPLADPTPPDMTTFAVTSDAPLTGLAEAVVLAAAVEGGRHETLVAAPYATAADALAAALGAAGNTVSEVAAVGGFALPIDTTGKPLPLAAIA